MTNADATATPALVVKPAEEGVEATRSLVDIDNVSFFYGEFRAIKDVSVKFPEYRITSIIGPSGCGKSTFLRLLNRMNDLIPGTHVDGKVVIDNQDIYGPDVDPVRVRRRIGMVFQRPNPFPMSIYDNILYGPRLNGRLNKSDADDLVEKSLKQAALWDEVKDRTKHSALALSGGQQQRLCIARAVAMSPEVILMDEPCSALDPIATLHIEQLMLELCKQYTIVIVTHNMQQAARVSDYAAFFMCDDQRAGFLVEYGQTHSIFTNPTDQRTEEYITGRFG
jgi:phosphate transport system ATP-binding protein